jgi:hypothetical protein
MKQFCILAQCRDRLSERLIKNLQCEDTDVYILTYKHAPVFDDSIHMPNSTWTTGRNRLLEHVSSKVHTYEYVIYLDDDTEINTNIIDKTGMEVFKENLLKYKPGIGFPAYWWHSSVTNIFDRFGVIKNKRAFVILKPINQPVCYDHCVIAISTHVIDKMLPYHDEFDSTSWWVSGDIFCTIARAVLPDSILQFNNVWSSNKYSEPYPNNSDSGPVGLNFYNHVLDTYTTKILKIPLKRKEIDTWAHPTNRELESTYTYKSIDKSKCNNLSTQDIYNNYYLFKHNMFWDKISTNQRRLMYSKKMQQTR